MFKEESPVIIAVFDEKKNQIVSWNRRPPTKVPYFDHVTFGLIHKMKKVGINKWKAGKRAYSVLSIYQALVGKVTLDESLEDSHVIGVV